MWYKVIRTKDAPYMAVKTMPRGYGKKKGIAEHEKAKREKRKDGDD